MPKWNKCYKKTYKKKHLIHALEKYNNGDYNTIKGLIEKYNIPKSTFYYHLRRPTIRIIERLTYSEELSEEERHEANRVRRKNKKQQEIKQDRKDRKKRRDKVNRSRREHISSYKDAPRRSTKTTTTYDDNEIPSVYRHKTQKVPRPKKKAREDIFKKYDKEIDSMFTEFM